jgi:hypothetical protein
LSPSREPDLEQREDRVDVDIREETTISDTQREAIIRARVGQGRFRANLQRVECAFLAIGARQVTSKAAGHCFELCKATCFVLGT